LEIQYLIDIIIKYITKITTAIYLYDQYDNDDTYYKIKDAK